METNNINIPSQETSEKTPPVEETQDEINGKTKRAIHGPYRKKGYKLIPPFSSWKKRK